MKISASDTCSNFKLRNNKNISKVMHDFSLEEFKKTIESYVFFMASRMKDSMWFGGRKPQADILNANVAAYKLIGDQEVSTHFVPFIQKLIVKPGSKVITVGDLHGDLKALLDILEELIQTGYLDTNFALKRDDVYLVFLGDYVNRGLESLSVMYLLSKLSVVNHGNVILIRGNHEYASTSKYFHKRFIEQKDVASAHHAKTTLIQELENKFAGYVYPDFLYWFDYLPMALYLGTQDKADGIQYIKFCHAGLELGYNPLDFLSSDASFLMLDSIDRQSELRALSQVFANSPVARDLCKAQEFSLKAESKVADELYFKADPVDFSTPKSPYHVRLGFQWDNFLTQDNDSIEFALSVERKRIYLGKKITEHILLKRSNHKIFVKSVVRGHQHLDEVIGELGLDSPMLSQIRQQAGVVKQWGGMVYTLGASDEITHHHSFILISMHQTHEKWSLRHYFKRPEECTFSFKMSKFFS